MHAFLLHYRLRRHPGTSLLEVVIAMGLLLLIVTGFARLAVGSYDGVRRGSDSTVATSYAQQGLEAARAIGRQNFTALTDGNHGLSETGNVYSFSGVSSLLGRFTRTITVGAAQRNSSDVLVPSGGISDPLTKNVTSTVTWTGQGGGAQTVSLSSMLTNWNVARWLLSTTANFATGVFNSTVGAAVGDGSVEHKTMSSLFTPVSFLTANPGGGSVATATVVDPKTDRLFVATGKNASAAELFVYDTSTITATSLPSLGSVELNSTGSAIAIAGDYAYVATPDSAAEIRVISIRDLTVAAQWDLPGTALIKDVAFDSVRNRLLVARVQSADSEFLALDLSVPTTMNVLSSLDFAMDLREMSVNGNYVYIATNSVSGELQILSLATLTSPTSCDISGTQLPNALSATGTHLFIARDGGAGAAFVDFANTPASPVCPSTVTGQSTISGNGNAIIPIVGLNAVYVLTSVPGSGINAINLTNYSYTATDPSGNTCDSGAFFGAYLYLGCRIASSRVQVWQGGNTSEELIYTDAPQNNWRITNPSNLNSTGSDTMLLRTGVNSLRINPGINGSTQFNKSFSAASASTLDMYVNTVSPWAFGLYAGNGVSMSTGALVTVTNSVYNGSYNTNKDEGAFTDFPVPDYTALRAAAVADAANNGCVLSYASGAQSVTITTLATKVNPCPANSIVFIEYSGTPNVITLNFNNSNSTFNYTIVVSNATSVSINGFQQSTTLTASTGYPAIITKNAMNWAVNSTNRKITINGIVFSEGTISNAMSGTNRSVTVNGSVVGNSITSAGNFRNFVITYATDYNNTPPLGFTNNYYGQNLSVQASNGSAVLLNTYVSGGIDKDPTTWQRALIPVADFGLSSTALTYFKIFDATGTNQPTIFIDDLRWIISVGGGGGTYPLIGTYTSPAFDSGSAGTVWARLRGRMSGSNAVTYRIRVASTQAGLTTALWTGPDGTSATSFTSGSWQAVTTDPGATGTRWIQWKATLVGNGSVTPDLEDVSLLYQ